MANIPFVFGLEPPPHYFHDEMYPNHIYRRQHARHPDPLDLHTLGKIALLGAHAAHRYAGRNGEMTTLGNSKDKEDFEVNLDVGLFAPEELTVKVVDDCIVVEGKHEEREDDKGYISRHFVRRYHLPKEFDGDAITSSLSADGVLTIHAPRPLSDDKPKEKIIPIKSVGPSDLFLKGVKSEKKDAVEQQNGPTAEKK